MRKKIIILLQLSWFALAISSEAVLMGYESFNYPAGETLSGKNDPNDGFKYSWWANYIVDADSLSMSNYPLTLAGGSATGSGGAPRALAFEGLGLDADELIDFSQDQTRYLSVMMKRPPGSAMEWILKESSTAIVKFGLSSGNQFVLRDLAADPDVSVFGGDCSTSNTYFIVLKIVARASGDDELFLKGYSDSDVITATDQINWTVTLSADLTNVLSHLDLSCASGSFDEIVIGTTWEDVAPGATTGLLMAHESFDYPAGDSLYTKNDPNDGFKYSWWASGYTVNADSLSMPNYPLISAGGAATGSGGAPRTLAFEGLGFDANELIDFSQEQTRYFSVMMQRPSGTAMEWMLNNGSGTSIVKFGLGSADQFVLRNLAADPDVSVFGGDCSTSDTYFMVLKMVAHASGDDEIFLQGYSSYDAIGYEPTNWTAAISADLSDVLTGLSLSCADGSFDEIVIGTSWDVVAPLAEAPRAATVLRVSPYADNVWEMAVSIPTPLLIDSYFPLSRENLETGDWTNIAHSIDGNAPFVVTNLSYATDTGSNRVIYVEADDAVRFFRVDATIEE